jgi:hypothetical protein
MKLSTFKLLTLLLCLAVGNAFGNASANLDQYRNGSASSPVTTGSNWVNGNAGQSNSHYMEGMSIPYRCVMSSLPTGTPITITFGYDVTHSSKHAVDFLTYYRRLEPHIVFGHPAEPIDPTAGTSLNPAVFTTFAIPAPTAVGSPMPGQPTTSFNALPSGERVFTLYGGTISSIVYGAQANLTASQAEQTITITFTSNAATAILAWGGHIGSRLDWGYDSQGSPNSAGGISGSPYHMRLKSWSLGNLGNTDRSLSANAVIGPPDCNISVNPGSQSVCQGNSFSITVSNSTGTPNFTYSWTGPNGFTSNTTTASSSNTITITNAQLVNGGVYQVTVTDGVGLSCSSSANITVILPVTCGITQNTYVSCPGGTSTYSGPAGTTYDWSVTGNASIQGSTTSQTVTVVNNSNGNACNGSYTVHLTVGGAGCSSTCTMQVATGDQQAPNIQCAASSATCDTTTVIWATPTATDDCDPNPVVTLVSTTQTSNSITKTWQAEDACGNISTCSTTYTLISCGNEYCGLTQGAYGSYGGQNCQGQNTVQQLTLALASNLYIGAPGRSLTLTLADVNCIVARLPGGTTPSIMAPGNLSCSNLHPLNGSGRIANVLLAQTITLAFNMRWDASMGGIHITDQYMLTYGSTECGQDSSQNMVLTDSSVTHIPQSVINYLGGNNTVADLWQLASDALGGVYVPTNPGDPSLSEINDAVDAFNEGFDECRFLGGFYPTSPRPVASVAADLNSFGVYPNPFSSSTTISLSTGVDNSNVKVDVVTVEGKLVATLYNGATEANKTYKFDFSGDEVAKAVYICRIVTDNSSHYQKFMMIK